MTATYCREIIPNNIDFKVIRQKQRSRIEANLIISSISGVTYNLKLDEPKLLSDATNVVDFFQSLDIKNVESVKIFCESTQCGNTEHISGRIEVQLKDKSIYIHCSKIHGLPR
jgi:hypothetical protein